MIKQISQNDYTILKQQTINKYIRLDILDYNFNIVDEVSGDLINLSVSVNADSDLRRSCQVELVVKGNGYKVQSGGKIWLDKYIRPWIGYESIHSGEIQWYNQGVFLINAPTYNYDATTKSLSFEGLDLMSKLTGVRDGQLEGLETIIHQGENVRDVIISTISQLGGFKKYIVNNCQYQNGEIQNVPNDIEINQGGTVYDILKQLRDILPSYEIFFNTDGVFIYQPIPTGKNESILIDDDLLSQIIISEDVAVDFENVKNVVEVWGQTHDIDNFATSFTLDGNDITLAVPGISSLGQNTLIGFTPTSDIDGSISIKLSGVSTGESGEGYMVSDVANPNAGGGVFTYNGGFKKTSTSGQYFIGKADAQYQYNISRVFFNLKEETTVTLHAKSVYKNTLSSQFALGKVDMLLENGLSDNTQMRKGIATDEWVWNFTMPKGSHFIDVYVQWTEWNAENYFGLYFEIPSGISTDAYFLVRQDATAVTHLSKDELYLILWNGTNWTFLGHQQAQAVAKDENPESPFYIYSSVGEIRLVLYGGEYDNIYSDDLAQQRANYELWKRTRLEDTITLTCIPIPWLNVNQLVEYTSHESGETHQYIIKSITTDYNETGTQTIVMSRYYPLYPDI